jgi:hypothetical protein
MGKPNTSPKDSSNAFSQVDMVRGRGEQFAKLLGDDYDIIGFDPR